MALHRSLQKAVRVALALWLAISPAGATNMLLTGVGSSSGGATTNCILVQTGSKLLANTGSCLLFQ